MCFPIQRWFTLGTVRDTFDIHAPCRRANIRSQGQKRNRRNIRRATDDAVDTAKDVVGSAWDEVGDVLSRSMYLPGLKPKENRADRPPSFSARMAKTRPNQSEPLSGCTLSSRTPICSRCVFVDAGRSGSAMPRGPKKVRNLQSLSVTSPTCVEAGPASFEARVEEVSDGRCTYRGGQWAKLPKLSSFSVFWPHTNYLEIRGLCEATEALLPHRHRILRPLTDVSHLTDKLGSNQICAGGGRLTNRCS